MIHSSNHQVEINGDLPTILCDFTQAIEAVYRLLEGKYGDEFARKSIVKAGELAFMTDDELHEEAERIGK